MSIFPWDWPGALKDGYQAMFEALMKLISFSINFDNIGIVRWLFNTGYGFGTALAMIIALFVIPAAFLMARFRVSAVYALVISLLSVAVGVMWFEAINLASDIGDALTRGALFIGQGHFDKTPSTQVTLPNFTFGNPIADAAAFGGLFSWSMVLLYLFVGYEIINIFLVYFGLLALYAYGVGPRTRRLFSAIVSVLLVTEVLGRPIAIAIIKTGNLIVSSFPGADVFWTGVVTCVCMAFAVLIQFILPFLLYRSVVKVVGKLNGEVRGLVRSRPIGRQQVDAKVTNPAQTNNRTANLNNASVSRNFKREVAVAGSATAAAALSAWGVRAAKAAVAVGSNVHPAVKAITLIGPAAIKAVGSAVGNRPTRPKSRSLDVHR